MVEINYESPPRASATLARWIFILAAVYGIPVLTAWMLFDQKMVGRARYQQPEIYYGFGSLGLAWQMVFILIATDPIRYRPLMLIAALFEKFFFSGLLIWLMLRRIAGLHWIPAAVADGLLGVAFVAAYLRTPKTIV